MWDIKKSKTVLKGCVSLAAISTVMGADIALAADEILVTATKREESIQDVPLAMSAFDAKFVERANLRDLKSLIKFTPGFSGATPDSFLDFVNVRGIQTNDYGNGGDPSVGFFKNGLYQGRTGSANSTMYDMERAEVLRGPQGFLYGRSSVSGAVSVHTAKPEIGVTNGYVNVGVGERGVFNVESAINLPVSDNAALRLAMISSEEDGWVKNTAIPDQEDHNGHDTQAARASFGMQGENWNATFIAEYENRDQSGTLYRAVEGFASDKLVSMFGADIMPGPDLRTIHADMTWGAIDQAEIWAYSAEINVDLGFANLTSLTGYKDHEYRYTEDYDGMTILFYDYWQDQAGDYFEQEFRLVSQTEGALSWYAGVSYFKENLETEFGNRDSEDVLCSAYYGYYYGMDNCFDLYAYWYYAGYFPTNPGGVLQEGNDLLGEYSGWSAYVDLTYQVNERLDIGLGVRFTENTKDLRLNIFPVDSPLGPWYTYGYITDGFEGSEESWDDITPRLIARYRPTDDMMVYGAITKGWKSGGNNSFGLDLGTGGPEGDGLDADGITVLSDGVSSNDYQPEEVWSYEVGAKGSAADGRVQYDVAFYMYNYTDLQLGYFDKGAKIANVGEVDAYGFEGTIQAAVSDNFDIMLSAAFNENEISDAEFIEPGSDGNRLPGTPEWMYSGMVTFHTPVGDSGEFNASLDFSIQTESYSNGLANQEEAVLDGWTDMSFRVGYEDDAGWSILAYVENLTDEVYFYGGYEGDDIFPAVHFGVSRPRTYGVVFTKSFGD